VTFDNTKESILLVERLYADLLGAIDPDVAFDAVFQMDPGRAKVLYAQRGALLRLLEARCPPTKQSRMLLESTLRYQTRWLMQKLNQFATPTKKELINSSSLILSWLDAVHHALVAAGGAAQFLELIQSACQAHLADLVTIVVRSTQLHGRMPSEEYEAETQLRVLHLDISTLSEPVIDVGCGRDACLVEWLRSHHIDTVGIDLFSSQVQGCLVADWLEFPFLPKQFGTVVAHLSFSLHFLHQHLRPDGLAARYAHQYMAILRSLRHGGRIAYAPGLPFIERLLPRDRYAVRRFSIERLPIHNHVTNVFSQSLGESPIYACHVERI
jgi:hypothetical protein